MKRKHPLLIAVLFLSIKFVSIGQSSESKVGATLDSLKTENRSVQADSLKVQILNRIIEIYSRLNTDSTLYYGGKIQDLANKAGDPMIALRASGFIADAYHTFGNLPKAMEICLNSIALGEGLPQQMENLGPTYSTLGDIYIELGEYRKALSAYDKLDPNDWLAAAFAHFGKANVYVKMKKLDSALAELSISQKRFRESENIPNGYRWIYPITPNWYNTRAKLYVSLGKLDSARSDLFTSLKMTLKTGGSYYITNSYNDIANLYDSLNIPDSAIYYAKKGLEEGNKISYAGGILYATEILSRLYDGVDDTQALQYLKMANEARSRLYGEGNIQVMKDMIAQDERRRQEIENAEKTYQDKLRANILLTIAAILTITTFLLFWNNRQKQKSKQKIEVAYERLKNTQSQLIQSEKMASLGELTAGIAHEIQNPLNFVNNFSEVSEELIIELKEELNIGDVEEAKMISDDVIENLQKIKHHGERASEIVKSMLQHSRTSTGEKEPTDINALCDEYLKLAFHGFRVRNKSFNAELISDLDSDLPKINVVPQDIGRVMLNLINNAFQAVNEKVQEGLNEYKPEVVVSTCNIEGKIEISVRDNGIGIPEQVRDKIFQPFFTNKPTGQGTGLGLSLSYDIVKAHGGELKVETKVGAGSTFNIQLPLAL